MSNFETKSSLFIFSFFFGGAILILLSIVLRTIHYDPFIKRPRSGIQEKSVSRLLLGNGSKVLSQHGGKKNWTEISLRRLSEEFRYNSVVAEDRWMGRRILSRATISSVDDGFNDATVTVLLTDTLNFASCNHDRSEHYYRKFGSGDNIWFIGVLVSEVAGLGFAKCEYFNIDEKPLLPKWRP